VNTVPGPQSVDEDTPLAIAGVSVGDVDTSSGIQVNLTVTNGTLTVPTGGGAFVGGNGTSAVALAGTLAEINAALAGLSYLGNLNFNGSDTLTIVSNDSSGGIDTDTIAITVNPVNDPPVITGDTTGDVTEAGGVANGTPGTPTAAGDLNAADVDNASDSWNAVTVPTLSVNGYGTFMLSATGLWSYTLDNDNVDIDVLNAGATLTDSFTVTTVDGTSQVVTVTVNGANDTPGAVVDFTNAVDPLQRDDTGGIVELVGPESVLFDDTDVDTGETALLRVTQVNGTLVDQTSGVETSITGIYGTLFMRADGTYRYVLDNSDPDTAALDQGRSPWLS